MYCQLQRHDSLIKEAEVEQFLMQGILYCDDEKIRKDFNNVFGLLATYLPTSQNKEQSFNGSLLKIMSKNFT